MTCHPSESLSLFPYHARFLINVFRQSFSMVYPWGQRPNINASFLAHRAHLWARGEAFYVETPARLGGSGRTGLRGGKRFCGAVCAPPVSVPVMAVQVRGPSAVWMERTALAPSPTAEATRFTEVSRTSPAANTVGMLVSNGSGGRPNAAQVAPSSSGSSWASVGPTPAR